MSQNSLLSPLIKRALDEKGEAMALCNTVPDSVYSLLNTYDSCSSNTM